MQENIPFQFHSNVQFSFEFASFNIQGYFISLRRLYLYHQDDIIFNLYHILLTNIFFIANKILLILFIKQKYSTNSKILKNTFLSIINNESQFIFHRIHRKYFPKFHK